MASKKLNGIKAVLFDLDGTLLQAEMNEFIPTYIDGLSWHFADVALHYTFCSTFREAITALLSGNGGSMTNEAFFLATLRQRLGIDPGLFSERLARYCADGLRQSQAFHPPPSPGYPDPRVLPRAWLYRHSGHQSHLSPRADRCPPRLGRDRRFSLRPCHLLRKHPLLQARPPLLHRPSRRVRPSTLRGDHGRQRHRT